MKNTYPLVSIVTPTFNQADYLAETIESILAQDYPNIEYIVLDDGSSDSTRDVLQQFSGRVRFEFQANMGQARTLNKGWGLCHGKYIGYLSSDDILAKNAVSRLVAMLEADPKIAAIYPDCDLINPRSEVIKKNVCRPFDYENLVIGQECYIGPGALFRKDIYDLVGGWQPDLKLAPDREFWMRVGLHGKFVMLDESLAGYRMHTGSISYYEKRPEVAAEYVRVLDNYFLRTDVPPSIRTRKDEAYSNAMIVLARFHLRSGDIKGGLKKYNEAIRLFPKNNSIKTIFSLFKTSVSKPVRRLLWALQQLKFGLKGNDGNRKS